jgi:hypothetical protein
LIVAFVLVAVVLSFDFLLSDDILIPSIWPPHIYRLVLNGMYNHSGPLADFQESVDFTSNFVVASVIYCRYKTYYSRFK